MVEVALIVIRNGKPVFPENRNSGNRAVTTTVPTFFCVSVPTEMLEIYRNRCNNLQQLAWVKSPKSLVNQGKQAYWLLEDGCLLIRVSEVRALPGEP